MGDKLPTCRPANEIYGLSIQQLQIVWNTFWLFMFTSYVQKKASRQSGTYNISLQ
jgi:hypothetical protein